MTSPPSGSAGATNDHGAREIGPGDITSNTSVDWMLDRVFVFTPAQAYVANMLQTLIEFPQRQKSASINLEREISNG